MLPSTLSPFFQHLFDPLKEAGIASSKFLPVNDMDEKEFGDEIRRYYTAAEQDSKTYVYLNRLINDIVSDSTKPFNYTVYKSKSSVPNAWAYPGGVIFVTQGLLDLLNTEGELVSVLAHEAGHIELGHCFQAVKYQLLTRKADIDGIGELIDFLNSLFFRYTYSKAQEGEADQYAYRYLLNSRYSPSSSADAFMKLKEYHEQNGFAERSSDTLDPVRDYLRSHPPLELRIAKFRAESDFWWEMHPDEKRYAGKKNLTSRVTMFEKKFQEEWVTAR